MIRQPEKAPSFFHAIELFGSRPDEALGFLRNSDGSGHDNH